MNSTGASDLKLCKGNEHPALRVLQVPASLILRTLGTTFEKGVC